MIPFLKKKDKSYKLNDYELPKLSDQSAAPPANDSPATSGATLPPVPTSDPTPPAPSGPTFDESAYQDLPSQPSSNLDSSLAPSFAQVQPPSSPSQPTDFNTDSLHSEVSRVKIDAMETKLNLLDAKMSSVDSKLTFIIEVLDREMSDETKEELKKSDVMNSLKKRGIR